MCCVSCRDCRYKRSKHVMLQWCKCYPMSRQSIHLDQSILSNALCIVSHVETVDTIDQSMSCFNGSNAILCRDSQYSMHIHVHMFLPITFLIFNGFSIRKKFWNAENQGFSTIPLNPIYVDTVDTSRDISIQ